MYIFPEIASAQTITGIVKDTANNPISYAVVILCSLPDTIQVNYVITDLNGNFELKSPENKSFLLQISHANYNTCYASAVTGKTITLEQEVITVGEVVVKGVRPISKLTSDGVRTTVANTTLSEMGTGNDVLKRIPMVSGNDGDFVVFGRGKAKIYINNREVRDPTELDNLNSADIQDVEVISNPGARYDATVSAIINIKTTSKKGDGFSFNTRSSFYTGENNDYINQLNTNYRRGNLDIFANVYYSDITNLQTGDISQTVSVDTLWYQNNSIVGVSHINKLNGTIGANYEIDDKHYVGFRYDLKSSPKYDTGDIYLTSDIYADDILYGKSKNRELKQTHNKLSSLTNLYYAGKINKLSVDFNVDQLASGSDAEMKNIEMSTEFGDRTLNSTYNIDNTLWATKLQLSYPVWKGKLLVGSEYVDISRADSHINDDLQGFSSRVDIDEQNLAFFADYKATTKAGGFSIGLRYEDATYDYLVDGIATKNKSSSYKQWFPNASFSKKINAVSMQLSYSSKVVRPTYKELSNNLTYGNRLLLETGNPYLKPTIKHDVSLVGVWKILQGSVSYSHKIDEIVTWIDRYATDEKVSVITHRNIGDLQGITAFIMIAPTFGVWKPKLSGGMQKQWLDLRQYGLNAKLNDPLLFASLNNIFRLPLNFMINIDGEYISKGHSSTVYLYKDMFVVDFGIAKSFLNKSLSVKLSVSDIFNQKLNTYQIVMPQTDFKNLYRSDSREISLTVRYNFNSARSKYKGSTAGESAKKRF